MPLLLSDHNIVFAGEVWNIFNALGLEYLMIPFPSPTNKVHRLIAPKEAKRADFYVMKSPLTWLIDNLLVKNGEGKSPKFNKKDRPVWYVLTEKGRKIYDELSVLDNFEHRFIEKFQPARRNIELSGQEN